MAAGTNAQAPEEVKSRLVAFLPRLRRFCHGLTGDRDLGDDLLQATVERALVRHAQWQAGTSLENWVFKMASNLNIDRLRAQRVRGISVEIEDAFDLPGGDELQRLEFRSELDAVRAALEAMPAELRAVITAVLIDGQAYKEVAELLGIPIGTVMSRLSRARQFVDVYVRRGPERVIAA
ncbi:RNA polymerase sigma factor [Sphingobium subterraneum]|uniref:RNA polymerase sigma-70 factor (ECF subfamily) n=1 Tax=Sphingobium subterraneum TaxID=627688 RepID=A0A841J2S0_9SPHN|nr:RNA polymerase sigma factor [Sphingobium subterraneum]MBB6125034.1 RNA polymerase sigma-70 factor (ECF subfamily) [Sphingobium subterraneum]